MPRRAVCKICRAVCKICCRPAEALRGGPVVQAGAVSVFTKPKVLPDMPAVSVLEGAAQIDALPQNVVQIGVLGPPFVDDLLVQRGVKLPKSVALF